eukprot:SAG31_NODE_3231_length_4514_cov_4.860249_3_plen_103_part_00
MLTERPTDLSPECVAISTPMLETKASTYIAALEARQQIERLLEDGLLRFEFANDGSSTKAKKVKKAYYASVPMKNTAPLVPKDLDAQSKNRNPGRGADYGNT